MLITSTSALKIVETGLRHASLILSSTCMRKKAFYVVHRGCLILEIFIPKLPEYPEKCGSDSEYNTIDEQYHSLKFLILEHCPY